MDGNEGRPSVPVRTLLVLLGAVFIATAAAAYVVFLLFYQGRFWTALVVLVTLLALVVAAIWVGRGDDVAKKFDEGIRAASADNVSKILIGLIPLLLIILNLMVRGSYSSFYVPLKVLPEEVGFDAQSLLQLSGALLFFMAAGYLLLLALFTSVARTSRVRWHPESNYLGGLSLVLVTAFALVLTIAGAVHLRSEATDEAGEVQRGCVVTPIEPWGMTLVGVRAQPVSLYWTGTPPTDFQPTGGPTLYLGQANGTLVLYEVSGGHVARIPTGAVVTRSIEAGINC